MKSRRPESESSKTELLGPGAAMKQIDPRGYALNGFHFYNGNTRPL